MQGVLEMVIHQDIDRCGNVIQMFNHDYGLECKRTRTRYRVKTPAEHDME